jgi:hypothetical protein
VVKECVIREGDCSIQGQEYVNNISRILKLGIRQVYMDPGLSTRRKCLPLQV